MGYGMLEIMSRELQKNCSNVVIVDDKSVGESIGLTTKQMSKNAEGEMSVKRDGLCAAECCLHLSYMSHQTS